jgi:hypothetical protein
MGTLDATHELELFDDVTPCIPPIIAVQSEARRQADGPV